MPVAAIAAAAITGGAAIYSASQQSKAAGKALDAQNAAAQQQLQAQQQNFDRIVGLNQPYITGGNSALTRLLQEYGLAPGGPTSGSGQQVQYAYDAAGNIVPVGGEAANMPGSGAPRPSPTDTTRNIPPQGGAVVDRTGAVQQSGAGTGPPGVSLNTPWQDPGSTTGLQAAQVSSTSPNWSAIGDMSLVAGAGQQGQATGGSAVDYQQLFQDRPDVLAEYQKVAAQADPNSPWFQQHGLDRGAEGFADWWLQNKPAADTYAAPMTQSQPQATPQADQPAQSLTSQGGYDLMSASRPTASAAPTFDRPDALAAPDINSYFQNYTESPGYQYALNEGLKAVNAASAARGKLRSGDAATALQKQGSGIAAQDYNTWVNQQLQKAQLASGNWQYAQNRADNVFSNDRGYNTALWQYGVDRGDRNFNTDQNNQFNRYDTQVGNLFNLAGLGQSAAGSVAGAGTNYANAASNIFGSQANAASQAAYDRAAANAGAVGAVAGAGANLFANWGGSTQSTPTTMWGNSPAVQWNPQQFPSVF